MLRRLLGLVLSALVLATGGAHVAAKRSAGGATASSTPAAPDPTGSVVAGSLLAMAAPSQRRSAPAAHGEQRDPLEPPFVGISDTSAGTFLGVKDELLLEPLRGGEVRDVKFNHGGSSVSLRLTFADGSRAAFKPLQTNPQTVPRKEIAAYRLNRLLGLNAVPPAAARTLHKDDIFGHLVPESAPSIPRLQSEVLFDAEGFTRGEVSYWIPQIADSRLDSNDAILDWTRWLSVGHEIPSGKNRLMAQLSTVLVFDVLQNNADRFSGGNLLASPDGRMLYFMDNTFGFQVQPEAHEKTRSALQRCQKFSRRMVAALRRLDARAYREALASEVGVLTDEEIESVIARREVVLRWIDGLIARHGEGKVLVFP